MKVVDTKTGQTLTSLNFYLVAADPRGAAFGKGVIAVVLSDSLKIFSRKTGELEQTVHGNGLGRAAFTLDGGFLAVTDWRSSTLHSGNSHHLVLRDIRGKKTIATLDLGFSADCLAVAEKHVAAHDGYSDRIAVVEATTGKFVKRLNPGTFRKTKKDGAGRMPIAISPAGDLLACGPEDDVVLYDIAGGKVARKLEGHLDTVRTVAFSPNGQIVASAAKDNTIRFWNVKDGKEIHAIKNLRESPSDLIFSADGRRIAVVYHGENSLSNRKAEIRSVELK